MAHRRKPKRTTPLRLAVALVFVASLMVVVTSTAALATGAKAATQAGAARVGAPTQAGAATTLVGGGGTPLQNPYGCYGRSDQPHISQHYPDRVAAQGWTICPIQLPYEHVEPWLYRQDCFFFICWWTQVGYATNTNGFIYYGAVRAVPSYTCNGSSSHLYKIVSYHEARDWAGKVYSAWTSNQSWVNCG